MAFWNKKDEEKLDAEMVAIELSGPAEYVDKLLACLCGSEGYNAIVLEGYPPRVLVEMPKDKLDGWFAKAEKLKRFL